MDRILSWYFDKQSFAELGETDIEVKCALRLSHGRVSLAVGTLAATHSKCFRGGVL